MNQKFKRPFREISPTLLGIVFAVLQGFTVYFTKNVENRISALDSKLERTWEITLVTKTELVTLQAEIKAIKAEVNKLRLEQQNNREAWLKHVAAYSH